MAWPAVRRPSHRYRAIVCRSGLPSHDAARRMLVADAKIRTDRGRIVVPHLRALRRGQNRRRSGVRRPDKSPASFEMGEAALIDVMAATFLTWSGTASEADSALRRGLPFGLTGELVDQTVGTARATELSPSAMRRSASPPRPVKPAWRYSARPATDATRPSKSARGSDGGGRRVDGKVTLPFDLAKQFRLDGRIADRR